MLLLVDAGNTRIKWALADDVQPGKGTLGQWRASGSAASDQAGQLADAWSGLAIAHALISNVAGPVVRAGLEKCLQDLAVKPEWFASTPMAAGVCNGYRNPSQLGCDRFASAIGAHALYPGEALVVATCGTATTVDAMTPDGVFLGGMILPGLGLMASSLARNTAQLPQVGEQVAGGRTFADNTDAAIVSGCIAAQAGAIERAIAVHAKASSLAGVDKVRCILSGGAAGAIAPHLWTACTPVDNLVLIGLHAVVRHAAQPGQ